MPMELRKRGEPKGKPVEQNIPPTTTRKHTRDPTKKQPAGTSKASASASSSSLGTSQSSQESLSIIKPHAKALHDAFAAALHVPGAEEWHLSAESLLNKVRTYAAEAEQRRGQPLEQLLPKTPMGKMMMSSESRRPARERDPVMEDSMRAIPEVVDLESEGDNAGPSGSQDSTTSTVDTKPKRKRKPAAQKISVPASPYHTRQRVTRLQAKLRRGSAASSTTTDTGRSSAGSQTRETKAKTKTTKKKVQETRATATISAPRDGKKRKINEEQIQPPTITSMPVDFNFGEYGKVSNAVKKRRMDGSEDAHRLSKKQEDSEIVTVTGSKSQVTDKQDSVSALAHDVDRLLKIQPTVRVTRLPSLVFREKLSKEPSPSDGTPPESAATEEAAEEPMDMDSPKTPRRSGRLRFDSTKPKPIASLQSAVALSTESESDLGNRGNEHALLTEDESDNTLQDEDKSFKTAQGRSSGNASSDSVELFEMSLTATPEPETRYSTAINSTTVTKSSQQLRSSEAEAIANGTFLIPPVPHHTKSGNETFVSQKSPCLNNKEFTTAAGEQPQPGTSASSAYEELNGTYVVPNVKPAVPSFAAKVLGKYMNSTYAVDSSATNTFPRSSNSRNKPDFGATFVQPKTPSLIPRARSGAFSSPQGSPTSSKQPTSTSYKPSKQPSTSSSSTVTNDTDGSSDTTSRPASAASQSSMKENIQKNPSKIGSGLVQMEKKRIETQDHLARMEQKQKLQEKQVAAERKREQHLKDRAEYQKLKNRDWAEKVKPKEPEVPGKKLPTGYVNEIVQKFGKSGFAKPGPHPSALPKHMKVPNAVASSCPDINKNAAEAAGSSMNKGVSAGNIWTGISSTISSAMAFVKPQVPNKLPAVRASPKVKEQEKKMNTPHDSSLLDDTFKSCDTTFNSTQDVNVSTYDITFYEDYDENLDHRKNKRIPKWASDSEKLKTCLFMQQPKFMELLEREVLPPVQIGYKIFPKRRDNVEEDE